MLNILKLIFYKILGPNKVAKRLGVKMGENCVLRSSYFGSEPYLIEMGDNVQTTRGVTFITHDSLSVIRVKYPEYKNADLFGKIIIGDNVFVGSQSIVLRGTTIEDNVIIGAGSLVKGHLKSDSVYAGVPAKYICSLDDYIHKNKKDFDYTKNFTSNEKRDYLLKKFN